MKINLFLDYPYEGEDNFFNVNGYEDHIELFLHLDETKTIDEMLKDKNAFDESVEVKREWYEDRKEEYVKLDEEAIKYINDNFENIMDSVEYIVLPPEEIENPNFIKENPIILSKKIVLKEIIGMSDFDRAKYLIDLYQDYLDQVYILMDGNEGYTKLTDTFKTICEIKKYAESIKKLNLSKMETIMYTYDFVRNRVYQFEDKDEGYNKSRDLSEVILGDKIVCLGYSNIFKALLDYMDIDSLVVMLDDVEKRKGHARNVIYVNDPKYDIDGVYYFDTTWDSKKKNGNNHYLYSYKYFAKTRKYMDCEDMNKGYYFKDVNCPLSSFDLYDIVEEIVDSGEKEKLHDYYRQINYMSYLVGSKEAHLNPIQLRNIILPKCYGELNLDAFFDSFTDVCMKFEREIPAETMLTLFNNVRKIEYYQNPEWFPFDINSYFSVYMNSDWTFDDSCLSSEEKLFKNIFGPNDSLRAKEFKGNMASSNIPRDIAGVKIAKVLQKVIQKKQNENLQ